MVLVIIVMGTITGCTNKGDIDSEVNLEELLSAVDYLVNIRYSGIDNINHDILSNNIEERTYNQIITEFNRDIKPYISVDIQYKEAENAFNAYKKRIENENTVTNRNYNDRTPHKEQLEDGERDEGDPSSDFSDFELMLSNIYNADGEILWKSISIEEAEQKTPEEIEEFLEIRQSALDSFSKKGKENREKQEEQARIEQERLEDSMLPELPESKTENGKKINMNDFPTDQRIQLVDGQYVIMIDDIDIYEETLKFKIYGIDYEIDIKDIDRPYSSCKGNDLYNFERVYYAVYDTGIAYVVYTSMDEKTNRIKDIELELRLDNNKIVISDTKQITTTKW